MPTVPNERRNLQNSVHSAPALFYTPFETGLHHLVQSVSQNELLLSWGHFETFRNLYKDASVHFFFFSDLQSRIPLRAPPLRPGSAKILCVKTIYRLAEIDIVILLVAAQDSKGLWKSFLLFANTFWQAQTENAGSKCYLGCWRHVHNVLSRRVHLLYLKSLLSVQFLLLWQVALWVVRSWDLSG